MPDHSDLPHGGHTLEDVRGYEGCAVCSTCGGFEGSTPTHCPGYQLSKQVLDRIYAGVIDFVDGRWVQCARKGLVICMPHKHTRRGRALCLRSRPEPYQPLPLDAVERWSTTS